MDEHNFRRFQTVMQVAAAVGAVIVFFVGLNRYIEAEQWARNREFRSALWLRQLDVLSKVAESASRIAVAVDDEWTAFNAAVRDYEQLYWGNLTFVDDPALVRAMDALRHEVRYFRQGFVPTDGLSPGDKVKQRVQGVAIACRRTIRKSGEEFLSLPGTEKP